MAHPRVNAGWSPPEAVVPTPNLSGSAPLLEPEWRVATRSGGAARAGKDTGEVATNPIPVRSRFSALSGADEPVRKTMPAVESPVGRGGEASAEVADEGDPGAARALQASTLLLLALSGSAVNGLAVLVFIRRPTLRSPSNRFVLSLVLANLLAAATVIPIVVVHMARREVSLILWWRQLVACLGTLSATASVFSILAIAVDRYCAVTSPLHYSMTATRQRSRLIIAFTWLLSFLLALPPLLYALLVPHLDLPLPTPCPDPEDLPSFPIAVVFPQQPFRFYYALFLAVLGFAIPLFALCWIYVHMYLAARKNSQRTRRHSLSALQEGPVPERRKAPPRRRCSNASLPALLFREEGRAVKTAALVIVSFLFCWAPFFSVLLLDSVQAGKRLPDAFRFSALLTALSSGPLTPFLYVFRNEAARTEAIKLLLWWRTRDEPGTPRWGDSIHSPLSRPRAPPLGRSKVPPWCPPRGAVSLDSGGERPAPQLSPRSRSWSERQDSVSIHSFSKCGFGDQVPMLDLSRGSVPEAPQAGPPPEVASNTSDKPTREGTFRLAFLPRSRRCQTCVRQNSDSSSGSGHPLLREGAAITESSPRRPHSPTTSVVEEMKDLEVLAEVPVGRCSGQQDDIILELEEQFSRRSALATQSRADRFSTSSNLTQETSLASSGMGSTVDGSVDMDDARRSMYESPWASRKQESQSSNRTESEDTESEICPPRRTRRKLQRLAAVEDLGDAVLPEEDVFEDLPEDNEEEEAGESKGDAFQTAPLSTATPTLILGSLAPTKARLGSGIKARFFRPAFRVPRYDF